MTYKKRIRRNILLKQNILFAFVIFYKIYHIICLLFFQQNEVNISIKSKNNSLLHSFLVIVLNHKSQKICNLMILF